MMMSTHRPSTQPSVRAVTLIAQEEAQTPLGEPTHPNRPIGFASIFLIIENPVDDECRLIVRSLDVIDSETGRLLLHQARPQIIPLMPLENATIDIHLTNHMGYGDARTVKAIAHYQVMPNGTDTPLPTTTIESPIVTVTK
ncbi:MAG: hypothetical protein VKL39_19160 [Leptolyngbyaceae bacterium]|nr:hypothetical protein [Leptolyngbyaceae bacterium]